MYILDLAKLPAAQTVDFLVWIIEHQIGNWRELISFIAQYDNWHHRETIPFECSEQEAMIVMLRWS
jgi:hypothetical protein